MKNQKEIQTVKTWRFYPWMSNSRRFFVAALCIVGMAATAYALIIS